jgi:hypothetical protein
MARIIQSPGVQITERDLSLRVDTGGGTTVLVTGFASQGPTSEALMITTMSEFETIYGFPVTAAERYFYYSCKEVLNSQATLIAIRLPYGSENGISFGTNYSALLYPAANSLTHANEPEISLTDPTTKKWFLGKPIYQPLTTEQYSKLATGEFSWSSTNSGATYDPTDPTILLSNGNASFYEDPTTKDISVEAGFMILNDLQTTINEIAEGHYIGLTDNSAYATTSPNFDSISTFYTLSSQTDLAVVNTNRLDFALSATKIDSDKGITSVSEQLEKVGFADFEEPLYQDYLSLGVFRVRRSVTDASLLSMGSGELYLGSCNFNRKQITGSGGTLQTAFLEDAVNDGSPTIKSFFNPEISKTYNWTDNSTSPTSRIFVERQAKALFPLGIYVPNSLEIERTKIIGSVDQKLNKCLRNVETTENIRIDVVADAGLTTIYSMTQSLSTQPGYDLFDDERFIDNPLPIDVSERWKTIAVQLVNFAENTRRDCMAIIDPARPIFISGKDSKIIDAPSKNFTQHIYTPLRDLAGTAQSNYVAMYSNWVKVNDQFTNKRFWCPFSGYAAAIFSRNDAIANPWSAPAGLNRGSFKAIDIALNPNQKQRDRLYEIAINPVVYFNGDGFVVMGQKTTQFRPTAFDRINVRLFLYLERATQRTLKYFVFEPNTSFTRTRIKNTITPIFELARATEGLYDYMIVCDQRNNTPDVIDNNELVIDIYLKPVRTAEFILVNFVATRTGQNFQELIQG